MHDHEFVAAEPADQIARARHLRQKPAELDQEIVADRPAEGMVDLTEAVKVENQECCPLPLAGRLGEQRVQLLPQRGDVGKTGEPVSLGAEQDLGFGPAEIGYVADVDQHKVLSVRKPQATLARDQRASVASTVGQKLFVRVGLTGFEDALIVGDVDIRLLAWLQIVVGPTDDLIVGSSEQRAAGAIDEDESVLPILHQDRIVDQVEDGTQRVEVSGRRQKRGYGKRHE